MSRVRGLGYDRVAEMVVELVRDREIYPNAPLRLVTAEARYPASARFARATLADIGAAIGDAFPIVEAIPPGVTVNLSLTGPASAAPSQPGYQFFNRERTSSITIMANRLAVDTTAYTRWEEFREILRRAVEAVEQFSGDLVGVERIGLRYMDEVRLPEHATLTIQEWRPYISEDLLPAAVVREGSTARTFMCLITLATGDESELTLRYGPMDGNIIGEGPLRLPRGLRADSFFLIDIDSYWATQQPHEHGAGDVLRIADHLHEPVRMAFETSITDRLRVEVLRKEPS